MQAIWCDLDNDGWVDLFVANDQSLDSLLRNKGDGTFEDVGLKTGLFDPRGAMGVAVTDVHADGNQALFVPHWVNEDPAFYVNDTGGAMWGFDDETIRLGLRKPDASIRRETSRKDTPSSRRHLTHIRTQLAISSFSVGLPVDASPTWRLDA